MMPRPVDSNERQAIQQKETNDVNISLYNYADFINQLPPCDRSLLTNSVNISSYNYFS